MCRGGGGARPRGWVPPDCISRCAVIRHPPGPRSLAGVSPPPLCVCGVVSFCVGVLVLPVCFFRRTVCPGLPSATAQAPPNDCDDVVVACGQLYISRDRKTRCMITNTEQHQITVPFVFVLACQVAGRSVHNIISNSAFGQG